MKDTWAMMEIELNIRYAPQKVVVTQGGLPQHGDYSWSFWH